MVNIRSYLQSNYWLVAILFTATLLRFYHLDYQSVWLDELYTLAEMNPRQSFKDVYRSMMRAEQQPPFYFYLVYCCFRVFGYTSFVLRFVSAAAGIAGVYALYLLGRELISGRVGLIAASLLCVNQFHLHYSQEGRPYAVFFLFMVIGFWRLVVFLKHPCWRNALLYGLGAGLMINGHFFGLFALLAQAAILCFFLFIMAPEKRKLFLSYSVVAGLIAIICFLPSLPLFLAASRISNTWIQTPGLMVSTELFRGFFANSDLVATVISTALIFYCIRLFQQKDQPLRYQAILQQPIVFIAVVILPWIVIVLLIALIRSHVQIPMIVDRYFISVLPAVLLLAATGIDQMEHRLVRSGTLMLYVVFSLTSILAVTHYYSQPHKAQFRELSQSIIDHNGRGETIVSKIGFHFSYFLDNTKVSYPIKTMPLDEYVQGLMQDSSTLHSFWYADGHGASYQPSEQSKNFIDRHFIIDQNIDFLDAWAKHFVSKSSPVQQDTAR